MIFLINVLIGMFIVTQFLVFLSVMFESWPVLISPEWNNKVLILSSYVEVLQATIPAKTFVPRPRPLLKVDCNSEHNSIHNQQLEPTVTQNTTQYTISNWNQH